MCVDTTAAMKCLLATLLIVCFGHVARADGCAKSLDYILDGLAGELPQPAMAYRNLLKVCLQTSTMANVKESYILRDGGIAVIAKDDFVFATAITLADFCRTFPRSTIRFITRKEVREGLTTGLVVLKSSVNSDLCEKIRGER